MTQKEKMARWLAVPGNRERKAASDKAYHEANKDRLRALRNTPEHRAKRAERLRSARAADPDRARAYDMKRRRKAGVLPRKEAWAKQKPFLHAEDVREKVHKILKAKGEKHPAARFWSLMSPCGKVFRFRNLTAFVEAHKELFTEDQLFMVPRRRGRPLPRVVGALGCLSPRRKNPSQTMHGWRWHIDGQHHETLLSVLPNDPQADH